MKAITPLILLLVGTSLCANTHPDSIYSYVYNKDIESIELVSKTTYSQTDKTLSILDFIRPDEFNPLQLYKVKTYHYHNELEDKMEKVEDYKVLDGERLLNKSVNFFYNEQGQRESITISTKQGRSFAIQSQVKSIQFDQNGRTTKREMYGLNNSKTLSKTQTTYNNYSYDEKDNIVEMEMYTHSEAGDISSSILKNYMYDNQGRLVKVLTYDRLSKKETDILLFDYSKGLKVKEYYVNKLGTFAMLSTDTTFYDHKDRVSIHKKYRVDHTTGQTVLKKSFVHFYSDEKVNDDHEIIDFASVKVKDFNNQSGEISISNLNAEEQYTLAVYDVMGRLIMKESIVNQGKYSFYLENVTGVLLTTLVNEKKEVQTQKFVFK